MPRWRYTEGYPPSRPYRDLLLWVQAVYQIFPSGGQYLEGLVKLPDMGCYIARSSYNNPMAETGRSVAGFRDFLAGKVIVTAIQQERKLP